MTLMIIYLWKTSKNEDIQDMYTHLNIISKRLYNVLNKEADKLLSHWSLMAFKIMYRLRFSIYVSCFHVCK